MSFRFLVVSLFLVTGTSVAADPPNLAFKPAGEGNFSFDTGVLKGRLKVDGKYQGLYPLVDASTGNDLTHPPGVFSFYRVLTTNHRYGDAVRDWPTRTKLLGGGEVEVVWPPAAAHPLEMTAVYRWTAPDTLDLNIAVRPEQKMPEFELFMSSYFTKGFLASVYRHSDSRERPALVPVDRAPGSGGGYVMFPKDEAGVRMIRDGRWTFPPNPVDWAVQRWLAAPLARRRDEGQGLTALMMCPTADCFAFASPWNPASADAGGYRSLYLSLFGRDLEAGRVAQARCRLIVRRALTDDAAIRCYEEYLKTPTR